MSEDFKGFRLSPEINRGIAAAGYVEPRPIQLGTIPAVLEGRDVLGLAQTGTGKTAAFALPLLERLRGRRGQGPRVLIVAPTRELASQICDEFRTLGRYTGVEAVALFGGVSVHSQTVKLRGKPQVLVACPGRLLDLMGQGLVRLDGIETIVLDEADHMFDMGFLPDVRRILAAVPERRQTLLFSATMPKEIRRLANRELRDPHVVEIDHTRMLTTIEHAIYPVVDKMKVQLLEHLIQSDGIASAIVFTRTKHRARRLAQQLDRAGHRAVALQGNMSQNARVRAMDGFRTREFDILVATDIAARGIDIQKLSHVINFDMPNTAEAYTHRIGRTGRAECEGKAYTFVTGDDAAMIRAVEARIGSALPRRKVQGFDVAAFPAAAADARRAPAAGTRQRGSSPPRRAGRAGGGNASADGAARRRRPRRSSTRRAS